MSRLPSLLQRHREDYLTLFGFLVFSGAVLCTFAFVFAVFVLAAAAFALAILLHFAASFFDLALSAASLATCAAFCFRLEAAILELAAAFAAFFFNAKVACQMRWRLLTATLDLELSMAITDAALAVDLALAISKRLLGATDWT